MCGTGASVLLFDCIIEMCNSGRSLMWKGIPRPGSAEETFAERAGRWCLQHKAELCQGERTLEAL